VVRRGFYVVQTDDLGSRVIIDGAKSAEAAARGAWACDERIDRKDFARTWNAAPEDGCRYQIGRFG